MNQEATPARLAANEGETQEVEGLRFTEPVLFAIGRCVAAERDEAGLLRMQRQCELLQPSTHRVQEAPGITLVLEPDNEVVGVAHDDHVAGGLMPSPAMGPKIEDVVQVDVGK